MFISQPPVGQFATGVPRVDVSILLELEEIASGIFARGMNQILQSKLDTELPVRG